MKLPRKSSPVQVHTAASIVIEGACLDDLRRFVEETLDLPAGVPIVLSDSSPQYIRAHHQETR